MDLFHEDVNGLNDQFQDLCDTQRNFSSEMGFSCPVEQSTGPGRPRFYIPEEVIRGLRDVHGVWKEVAKEVLVSYKTTLRRRHQYSMEVNVVNVRYKYSKYYPRRTGLNFVERTDHVAVLVV